MAKQRDVLAAPEMLQQSQREFLAAILDGPVALIRAAGLEHLLPIGPFERTPGNPALSEIPQ